MPSTRDPALESAARSVEAPVAAGVPASRRDGSEIGRRGGLPLPDMRVRGFTLLEVLVALAIFGVAATVLASGYVNVLQAYEFARRGNAHEEDIRFARAQLLTESDRQKAEDGADFDTDTAQVRWHATIEPTDTADLFEVTFVCEVTDTAGARDTKKTTETFQLLRPTWSDGTDKSKLMEKVRERILELQQKRTP